MPEKVKALTPQSDTKMIPSVVLRTHVGLVRSQNEDSLQWYASHDEKGKDLSLAIVADGMGGHAAGEVASQLCIEAFGMAMRENQNIAPSKILSNGLKIANDNIFSTAERDQHSKGMGTTCSALLFNEDKVWMINVGDSRIYHFREGNLKQLSVDDTLVNHLIKDGQLSAEDAPNHPNAHVLVKAVGTKKIVEAKTTPLPFPLNSDDLFLVCSDGLYDMVSQAKLVELLEKKADLNDTADQMIQAALDHGGKDNISLILVSITFEKAKCADQKTQTQTFQTPTVF